MVLIVTSLKMVSFNQSFSRKVAYFMENLIETMVSNAELPVFLIFTSSRPFLFLPLFLIYNVLNRFNVSNHPLLSSNHLIGLTVSLTKVCLHIFPTFS